jgi:ribosomal protein L11 methyltransferase
LNLHKIDYTDARIPYQDLYIYYLEGSLQREKEPRLGPHFLGNWIEDGSSFLFFSRPTTELIQGMVDTNKGLRLIDEFHFTYEEWQGGKIKPFTVPPFFIVPPWEDSKDHKGEIKMLLDPGVVFGTTLHPTTRDCLLALARVYEHYQIDRVLDLGTGTGILAVGAALLGAESVVAIDINPLAVNTALSNVRLNGLEEKIVVEEGLAETWSDHLSDLVIANIHYDVIIQLIKARGFLKKKWFIFSGLMRSQAERIRLALSEYPSEIVQEWNHDMVWHTFLGRVEGSSNE